MLGTYVVLCPVISCAVCWSSSGCLFCSAQDECCGIVQLVWSDTLKVHLIFRYFLDFFLYFCWAKAQGWAGMQLHEHIPSSLQHPCCFGFTCPKSLVLSFVFSNLFFFTPELPLLFLLSLEIIAFFTLPPSLLHSPGTEGDSVPGEGNSVWREL